MNKTGLYLLGFSLLFVSCGVLKKSPKTTFVDGFYVQKIDDTKQKVYVDVEDDNLRIHLTKNKNRRTIIDTTSVCHFYPKQIKGKDSQPLIKFNKHSLDIDFLTIPLKYRFSEKDVPHQLNANLNGAVYVGYRTDRYTVNYAISPLQIAERNTNHAGFSFGLFTGLGNTVMNATVTDNKLDKDYDGIVWNKGVAGIFAIDNFTLGIALGFDNLLDKNQNIWLFENKPWLGLSFGLNLN